MDFARLHLTELDILPYSTRSNYYDLDMVIDNDVGRIELCNTQTTWKNIDFKTLMGSLWDKYELYSLQLVSFQTIPATIGGSGSFFPSPFNLLNFRERSTIDVYMSGLSWQNCSYSAKSNSNNSLAHVCSLSEFQNNVADLYPENWSNTDVGGILDVDGVLSGEIKPLFFRQPNHHTNVTLNITPSIIGRLITNTDTDIISAINTIWFQYRCSFLIQGVGEPK